VLYLNFNLETGCKQEYLVTIVLKTTQVLTRDTIRCFDRLLLRHPSIISACILKNISTVTAKISYLSADEKTPEVRVYPPASGLPVTTPVNEYVEVLLEDARTWQQAPGLDEQGYEFHQHASKFSDFYDEQYVRKYYYPEVVAALKAFTGAREVFVFDHNVRSTVRAARGQHGVRTPVDAAHVDYTLVSGPRRIREILNQAGRLDLISSPVALINLWRPITGPVEDVPLALCDARSVGPGELVETKILHFQEGQNDIPGHLGEIYSLYFNARHRWSFVSRMQTDDVLLLKCYDSRTDGRARFLPHTGFKNPACPQEYTPRESIEARTLVVY